VVRQKKKKIEIKMKREFRLWLAEVHSKLDAALKEERKRSSN
jgi:hypothetical protein